MKRNVARTVNSQQMFEYILHCLKTTYKYFAQSLSTQAANHKRGPKAGRVEGANAAPSSEESGGLSDFSHLSIHCTSQSKPIENGPEDSDCIIEEEEEIEEFSDSDEEREKEKADPGKSSISEDEDDEEEQDEDVNITDEDAHNRQHLDSFTTEDEEIFLVDEISGEELLSDEEGPDLDTPGSMDEEEEEEVDLVPVSVSPLPSEDQSKDESPGNKNQKRSRLSYEFTKQAFTRGKVSLPLLVTAYLQHLHLSKSKKNKCISYLN